MQQKVLVLFLFFLSFSLVFANNQPKEEFERNFQVIKPLLTPKQQEYIQKRLDDYDNTQKKILTIFYFTTADFVDKGVKNLSNGLKKLSTKYNIQGMVVLNGFPKNFTSFIQENYAQKNTEVKIKVHPYIYQYFSLQEVPAYALSACKMGDSFRFKECDNFYLVKGEGSLEDFLLRVAEDENTLRDLYFELIKPDDGESK